MIESPLIKELVDEATGRVRKNYIVRTLVRRFGAVDPEIAQALEWITDEDRLNELHDAAVDCVSLEAFRARLGS